MKGLNKEIFRPQARAETGKKEQIYETFYRLCITI